MDLEARLSVLLENSIYSKIMLKINPGFSKSRPAIHDSVYDVKENEVYEGLTYLIVAKKQ